MNKGKFVMYIWLAACAFMLYTSLNFIFEFVTEETIIDKLNLILFSTTMFVLSCVLLCYLQTEKMPRFIVNMQKQKNINSLVLFFSLLSTNIFLISFALILNIALFVYDNLVENKYSSTLTGQNLVIEILKTILMLVVIAALLKNIETNMFFPEKNMNDLNFYILTSMFLLFGGSLFLILLCYLNYGHIEFLKEKLNAKAHVLLVAIFLISLSFSNIFWLACLFSLLVLNLHRFSESFSGETSHEL